MSEVQGTLFPAEFNQSIKIETRPERLSADAGALLMRDLMDRLGLPALVRAHLDDPRDPGRITHPFLELFRTWVLLMMQGFGDQKDVELLQNDPILRLAVSDRSGDGPLRPSESGDPEGLCSQSTLSRLLYVLGDECNREGLARIVRQVVAPLLDDRAEATVDLDSFPHEVHGHQPGTAYNGHYRMRCFHPLVASLDGRYFLGGRLREGNAHTADGGLEFVLPILRWLRQRIPRLWLRADAGFPAPDFLERLETEGIPYVCRLRSNSVLERKAAPFLRRPPGRPPAKGRTWFHELRYQAGSWEQERRVVLVVLERPDDQHNQQHLFLDHFFLLSSASPDEESAPDLLQRYRQRGTAESDFGSFKSTLASHSLLLAPTQVPLPRPVRQFAVSPIRHLRRQRYQAPAGSAGGQHPGRRCRPDPPRPVEPLESGALPPLRPQDRRPRAPREPIRHRRRPGRPGLPLGTLPDPPPRAPSRSRLPDSQGPAHSVVAPLPGGEPHCDPHPQASWDKMRRPTPGDGVTL